MREQKGAASKEASRLKVIARRQRFEAEEARRRAELEREERLRLAFAARPRNAAEQLVDRAIADEPEGGPLGELLRVVSGKAPRLIEPASLAALRHVAALPFARPPSAWKPKGKGRETLFRGLCEHLLAKYPMPPFLWSAFFEDDAPSFGPFVAHVAGGGSVYEGVKKGLLPVPLTRKMCHDLMATSADVPFFRAVRRVGVRAYGGSPRLLAAWMATPTGRRLHAADDEAFWATVVEWFAKNPLVDPGQVAPLVDFLAERRRRDASFSMKGRTVLALLRAMAEWHDWLARVKAVHGLLFRPSGFRPFELARGARDASGNHVTEVWSVNEITTSKALADEGRELSHCVYSYAASVERGHASIWSLTLDGARMVTIEVRNEARRVVQARGKHNRATTAREFAVMSQWAGGNGLQIELGRW